MIIALLNFESKTVAYRDCITISVGNLILDMTASFSIYGSLLMAVLKLYLNFCCLKSQILASLLFSF